MEDIQIERNVCVVPYSTGVRYISGDFPYFRVIVSSLVVEIVFTKELSSHCPDNENWW